MTSSTSPEPRNTSHATVRTWVRSPFGIRGERSTPTRPAPRHAHELPRYVPPPLV